MARKPTATTKPAPALATAGSDDVVTVNQTVAALNDSVAGAFAGFEKTQTEVKSTMDKAVKSVEAFMKSSQIWAAGVQDLHKTFAATAQAQVEAAMGTMKAMSGVKSIKEAMDLQTTMARASMETAMAETGKLTDASVKLTEQALAPITARVTLAVEKFGRVA